MKTNAFNSKTRVMNRDKNAVLIVDANPEAIQLYTKLLKGYEFVLLWAPTADRAHAILRSRDLACVVVEQQVEDVKAIDFIREMREKEASTVVEKPTPVILLVGDTNAQTVLSAKELGVTEILIKPVNATRLRKGLAKALFTKNN